MKKKKIILSIIITSTLLVISCDDDNLMPEQKLNEDIDAIAARYVKVGAMIGIIRDQQEELVYSYGVKSVNTNEKPDENTVFDIGSITKSFTAILTTDMYINGHIQDEVVGHYLPSDKVTMPTKDGVEITFSHLLTHMSGIPRTPHSEGSIFPRPEGFDELNPYAAYSAEDVYNYLTNYCTLEFTPGTFWGYSNTGGGLVGHVLGLIDGTSYKTVLQNEIFDVLQMNNSSLFLSGEQLNNQALGHNSLKQIVPFYTANDIFQGCGMIKSSLADMFKYLKANMGLIETPLINAMNYTHQKVDDIYTGSLGYTGIGWFITSLEDGTEIVYSAGDTQGHSAFLGFDRDKKAGVIILLNYSKHDGTNINMGKEILEIALKSY